MTNVALIAHAGLRANRLFDSASSRDDILERFHLLRENLQLFGIACQTADMFKPNEIDVLIFHDILNELAIVLKVVRENPNAQLIYVPSEPAFVIPLHDENTLTRLPVDAVMTWNDRIAGKFPNVVKCNIGQPVIYPEKIPNISFANKKFICSIFANKPSSAPDSLFAERIRAIDFFSQQPLGMDLYGIGWEKSFNPFVRDAYRGRCENKKEVQQQYKFSIAYENVEKIPGLITEKIFDCFAAGTVPIYLGAPNVEDYIPASCFINFRDFTDYVELYDYLSNMSADEYQSYLDAAKDFINGPQYQSFTSVHHVEIMLKQVSALVGRKATPRSLIKMKWQLLKVIASHPQVLRPWRRYRHFLTAILTIW